MGFNRSLRRATWEQGAKLIRSKLVPQTERQQKSGRVREKRNQSPWANMGTGAQGFQRIREVSQDKPLAKSSDSQISGKEGVVEQKVRCWHQRGSVC